MRIVALSDTHTKHKQVIMPEGEFDVLVHAGDMTGRGNYHEFISVGNWFRAQQDKFTHRIMVAGNHDIGLMFDSKIIRKDHFDKGVIYLEDKGVVLNGVKFYGTPWMPQFYNWAFMRPEEELKKYYDAIPDDTEVLITHCPPYGILDTNSQEEEGERCGSINLLKRVKELKNLKVHIFGHIHDHGGKSLEQDGVRFYNVCALNYQYMYQNAPQVIEI